MGYPWREIRRLSVSTMKLVLPAITGRFNPAVGTEKRLLGTASSTRCYCQDERERAVLLVCLPAIVADAMFELCFAGLSAWQLTNGDQIAVIMDSTSTGA